MARAKAANHCRRRGSTAEVTNCVSRSFLLTVPRVGAKTSEIIWEVRGKSKSQAADRGDHYASRAAFPGGEGGLEKSAGPVGSILGRRALDFRLRRRGRLPRVLLH